MLFSLTLLTSQAVYYSLTGWFYNSDYYEKEHGIAEVKYTKMKGAFVLSTVVTILACGFVGILFVYHTVLILSGQSTWEQTRREDIDYIKKFKKGYDPFNEGMLKNIKTVFCHSNQLR